MKQTGIILFCAGLLLLGACNTAKKTSSKAAFKTTPGGIRYRMLYDKPGSNAAVGDLMELDIRTSINDSLVFSSKNINEGKPVKLPLNKPKFNGDLAEALALMSPGDSMIAMVSVDSLKAAGQRTQPWMKDGGNITYVIHMYSVLSKEEIEKKEREGSTAQMSADDKQLQQYFAKHGIKPMKTASGLYYTINTPGSGANARSGQSVYVNYTGHTMDGNVFDSNIDPKFNHVEPLVFPVGEGRVIKGWDEGLQLLNKGAKASFYIPSPLAYGENSPSAAIPANSILIFDVELLDIK